MVSGSLAAGAIGGLLGFAGSLLTTDARAMMASFCAIVAIVFGLSELLGKRVRLLQRDRETPRSWTVRSPLSWGVRNGVALGLGAGSRLGFPLWYVIPAAALLSGSPALGAALYGTYGLARTGGAYGFMALTRRSGDFESTVDRVLGWRDAARRLCAAELLLVGVVTAGVVGL